MDVMQLIESLIWLLAGGGNLFLRIGCHTAGFILCLRRGVNSIGHNKPFNNGLHLTDINTWNAFNSYLTDLFK